MKRINLKSATVARSNTVRDINRRIVLNYVREKSPISRSEIADITALQRSTISLIVEELKNDGFITEIYGESSGGRPPILLSLKKSNPVALGIAVTTIKTIVATSDLTARVIEKEEFDTDPDVKVTMSRIKKTAQKLIAKNNGSIHEIGVSLPGIVDSKRGIATFIPKFKWRNLHVVDELKAATGLNVRVENDANAAALAELWFGQPEIREFRNFIFVLVEEGIGAGIVYDGQINQGKDGTAGEFGHMTIGQGAPVACATGSRECWESFASERAAIARYKNAVKSNKKSNAIDNIEELVDLALAGDAVAQKALQETAYYLGVGIANIIQGLGPEAIIVGGTIVRYWSLVIENIKSALENGVCRENYTTKIVPSTLGLQSDLMGALSLILVPKFAVSIG
ncbi:MAG: ROK family transcriptional regulator [Acidobacteriota bacterium]|nr:ROK family transcriptional regulator [Acidobacteriota bacterium]